MKFLLGLILVSFLISSVKSDCLPLSDYIWGYWGVDLAKTGAPNIIWDTTDEYQLTEANNRGMTIWFPLEKILFDLIDYGYFRCKTYVVKSDWQKRFDDTYGNSTNPIIPHNIAGLTANSPNGFFLGQSLMWYQMSYSDIETIATYIKSKFPSSIVAYDEGAALFTRGRNCGDDTYNMTLFPQNVDYISINYYFPWDLGNPVYYYNLSNFYYDAISFRLRANQFIIWGVPMYSSTVAGIRARDCAIYEMPVNYQTCEDVMASWAAASLDFLCSDMYCDPRDVPHTARVQGLWLWHFDNRPGTDDDIGLEGIPYLQDYEQFFGDLTCETVASASFITINIFLIISIIGLL